jgi:hypothetical protein
MLTTPIHIQLLFIITALIAMLLFYLASNRNKFIVGLIIFLAITQALLASTGFFLNSVSMPPRLFFVIGPSLLLIIICFSTSKGSTFLNQLNYTTLNLIHLLRIPVEICLFYLFGLGLVPESMTFEGRNFDILSGLTAPFIVYFGYYKKILSNKVLLLWNLVCLGLVLQVVITGVLSAPSPVQQFSFEQPNIAVLVFPYVWLPGMIVPLVLFTHLASIRKILIKEN